MQPQSPPPPPPPPGRDAKGGVRGAGSRLGGMPRWSLWVLVGVLLLGFVLAGLFPTEPREDLTYSEFRSAVTDGRVETIEIDNNDGDIDGELEGGTLFTTTGPVDGGIPDEDLRILRDQGVEVSYVTPSPSFLAAILPYIIVFGLFIGFFIWMQRRAQG
ncbi:MAG TPA: ATP-dependent metallopeptidase FtsH/Yme1/Tma family protein, partial [Acidimicrobiales bacterium]